MGKKTRAVVAVIAVIAIVGVWEVLRLGILSTTSVAFGTRASLTPSSHPHLIDADGGTRTRMETVAIRSELENVKLENHALRAKADRLASTNAVLSASLVTPAKDALQQQGEMDVQQLSSNSTVPLGYQQLEYAAPAPKQKQKQKPVQPPMLVITHLLKAGGSTIASLLRGMGMEFRGIRQSNIAMPVKYQGANAARLEEESKIYEKAIADGGGPDIKKNNYFNVGMARNPCSYLLSVWNFQRQGPEGGHGEFPFTCQKKGFSGDILDLLPKPEISKEESIKRFRKWLRVSAGKTSKIHFFSLREFYALQPKLDVGWDDGQYYACLHDVSPAEEDKIASKLQGFDWAGHYDCIVHTENIAEDMKQCTYKYADWIMQDRGDTQTTGTASDWHDNLEETVDKANMTRLAGYTNNINRHVATCEEFYDRETIDFVWAREGHVAKSLGYDSCCDPKVYKNFY